jgi:uncharacterized protein YecT (DUF1311 family)
MHDMMIRLPIHRRHWIRIRHIIEAHRAALLTLLATSLCPLPSIAASFDCEKATTVIEKMICANSELSDLDEIMGRAYSTARYAEATRNAVKLAQQRWIKETRNQCTDVTCLRNAYTTRLNQLAPPITFEAPDHPTRGDPPTVIMGRCHMLNCWWWGIDASEQIETRGNETLVKVTTRQTSAAFSELYYLQHNYPDNPPPGAAWDDGGSFFVLCSKRYPVLITPSDVPGYFSVDSPYDSEGNTLGATEGIASLYRSVCPKHSVVPGTSLPQVPFERLRDPIEIFGPLPGKLTPPLTSISESALSLIDSVFAAADRIKSNLSGPISKDCNELAAHIVAATEEQAAKEGGLLTGHGKMTEILRKKDKILCAGLFLARGDLPSGQYIVSQDADGLYWRYSSEDAVNSLVGVLLGAPSEAD